MHLEMVHSLRQFKFVFIHAIMQNVCTAFSKGRGNKAVTLPDITTEYYRKVGVLTCFCKNKKSQSQSNARENKPINSNKIHSFSNLWNCKYT
jgi:hypothetical protein